MLDTDRLSGDLLGIAGEDGLSLNPDALAQAAVDGRIPRAIVRPASGEQAVEFLRYAATHGLKVAIRGGGTRTNLGNPISGLDLVLSTERLDGLTEYSPADLMVGVQAGTPLAGLQAHLEKHGQFLPVEATGGAASTVGGAIAVNASGPYRLIYGPARDWLIGVKFILASGTAVKSGGRVVKNVAGYDMNKLMIGSLGTLALLTEMNFKLMPLPPDFATLICSFDSRRAACETALKIINAGVFPAALTVLDRGAAAALNLPASGATLLIEVRNTRLAVERQVRDAAGLSRAAGARSVEQLEDRRAQKELWQRVSGFSGRPDLPQGSLVLKVGALPDRSAEVLGLAEQLTGQRSLALQSLSHAGHGLTWLTAQYDDEDSALEFIRQITGQVEREGGSVAVESAPLSLKERLGDVWGAALSPGELRLMQALKQKLDPAGTLNPGRYAGRL